VELQILVVEVVVELRHLLLLAVVSLVQVVQELLLQERMLLQELSLQHVVRVHPFLL
jgi:hypothetical protein